MRNKIAKALGIVFKPSQSDALDLYESLPSPKRVCYYHPPGEGKTFTALASLALEGAKEVVIITPPSTTPQWQADADKLGIKVTIMSHAKFRMKDTKLSRHVPIVIDEFHMLGGNGKQGWSKLDSMAPHMQASIIVMSATPSYNDAERVYCVQHVLAPDTVRGGFPAFLYANCILEPAFKGLPKVVGFHKYRDAEEFLASLPYVAYVPDTAVYEIEDTRFPTVLPDAWWDYGWDARAQSLMRSLMGRRISYYRHQMLADDGTLRDEVAHWAHEVIANSDTPVLVYCDHATIAEAAAKGLGGDIITGRTSKKQRDVKLADFKAGKIPVLVATATITTGTDGLDKVCNTLILLQDTPDDSLRRQIVGRILPRGTDTNYEDKRIVRALYGEP